MNSDPQIAYIDQLLPLFGCHGVDDMDTLFNKSTITDWDQLRKKLNFDLPHIKSMFPTKSLNLSRLEAGITTPQQALALLRGLLKISSIPYAVVRYKNQEFLRLNLVNNKLCYYIIHKQMSTATLEQIEINKDYSGAEMGIVKKFYVKFSEEQQKNPKFVLLCGGQVFSKSSQLYFNNTHDMWELKFFSRIVNLCDLPKEFTDCLFFGLLEHHKVKIYSNIKCQLYIETYKNPSLIDQLHPGCRALETFVEYVNDSKFDLKSNIIRYMAGMGGYAFGISSSKYDTHKVIDMFDGTRQGSGYIQAINKYGGNLIPPPIPSYKNHAKIDDPVSSTTDDQMTNEMIVTELHKMLQEQQFEKWKTNSLEYLIGWATGYRGESIRRHSLRVYDCFIDWYRKISSTPTPVPAYDFASSVGDLVKIQDLLIKFDQSQFTDDRNKNLRICINFMNMIDP